ncbi:unnamed protein product [Colias eurytheme]|nr:unnamed protein product [Colias eurytheme]
MTIFCRIHSSYERNHSISSVWRELPLGMAPTQSKHMRKNWDEEQMVKAIKMVREKKMGTLKAAKLSMYQEQLCNV